MLKKKRYSGSLSFRKGQTGNTVSLGASGISMPIMDSVTLEEYRKEFSSKKDRLKFGVFGNDPKFYDANTVDDITPKPEDFIEQPFRLLSATVVGGGTWKATDFSDERVLRGSMSKLDGVPLYKEHETDLDNWVGLVNGVKWAKGFTDSAGLEIPAGIDGIVAIDKVTNPKVARGVLAGAIHSNSVTVDFDWEMSHTFENEFDFFNRIGEIGSDGKMIRRIVVAINDYHESSLVWLGADPFAKAINADGDHKMVDIASVYSFTKQAFTKQSKIYKSTDDAKPDNLADVRSMSINFAVDKNVLSLAKKRVDFNKNNTKMNKFLAAFILAFGKDLGIAEGETPTDDQMEGFVKKLSFNSPDVEALNTQNATDAGLFKQLALSAFKATEGNEEATEVDLASFTKDHKFVDSAKYDAVLASEVQLKADKKVLEDANLALEADAKVGKDYLKLKREEAIRLYKVAVGQDNADAAVVAMFDKAGDKAVDGLLKQYAKNATTKFSGTCADCGSGNFSFRSSIADPAGADGGAGTGKVEGFKSYDDIYAERSQGKMDIAISRDK